VPLASHALQLPPVGDAKPNAEPVLLNTEMPRIDHQQVTMKMVLPKLTAIRKETP
jgi:hypothetical protein